MQKIIQNIFLLFFVNVILTGVAIAQNAAVELLARADSLYEQSKYKEAYIIYKQILEQHQSYSEQMLAKAAFIVEGTENYDEALYYLNLLYARRYNEALYNKIIDLAARYELPGYTTTDEEFLIYLLRSYMPFWGSLLIILTGLVMWYIIRRYRKQKTFAAIALLWIVTSGGIIYAMQTFLTQQKAIIRSEKAFIMSAPAAGAELIFTVQRGHCFKVSDSRDIWCQVQWNDKTGYVRRNNLWMIE
jgi:tetratricopeptide (TPR) repeat protein